MFAFRRTKSPKAEESVLNYYTVLMSSAIVFGASRYQHNITLSSTASGIIFVGS